VKIHKLELQRRNKFGNLQKNKVHMKRAGSGITDSSFPANEQQVKFVDKKKKK